MNRTSGIVKSHAAPVRRLPVCQLTPARACTPPTGCSRHPNQQRQAMSAGPQHDGPGQRRRHSVAASDRDGLHYASAVERDLRLAAAALAPSGVILMHDCIGMWGTNVRAGIFRFLADRSEFRLSHPRFSELYRSIGFVFRADEHPDLMKRFRSSEPDASAMRAATSSIVSSIMRRLEPNFVIELAAGAGVPKAFLDIADVPAISVAAGIQAGYVRLEDALAEMYKAWQDAGGRDGLLVSFGLVDHLSEGQLRELLGWIRDRDVLAAFGFTPPGEIGVAGPHSRSFRHMVRFTANAGLIVAAPSRCDVDPSNSYLRPART